MLVIIRGKNGILTAGLLLRKFLMAKQKPKSLSLTTEKDHKIPCKNTWSTMLTRHKGWCGRAFFRIQMNQVLFFSLLSIIFMQSLIH